MTTQTVVLERKDMNLHKKLAEQHKIPVEYTAFRDSLAENLREIRELNCKTYVPQLYNILRQAGIKPKQARAVVLDDGVNVFGWSDITIDAIIRKLDPNAFDQKKSMAGKISAEVKKARKAKLVATAVTEATHRGPGRPPKTDLENEVWYSTVVDCDEFAKKFADIAATAAKTTNKMKIEVSNTGRYTMSVYLVGAIAA